MTDKEALAWVAHRAVACYPDPDYFATESEEREHAAYTDGVTAVIKLIEAALNDKICPDCGNAEHRPGTMPGISMTAFNLRHGADARMLR